MKMIEVKIGDVEVDNQAGEYDQSIEDGNEN